MCTFAIMHGGHDLAIYMYATGQININAISDICCICVRNAQHSPIWIIYSSRKECTCSLLNSQK